VGFFAFLIVSLARPRFGDPDDVWLHGGWAYATNLFLVTLFALQHSGANLARTVMDRATLVRARCGAKRCTTRRREA
jgi:hypothetical protein